MWKFHEIWDLQQLLDPLIEIQVTTLEKYKNTNLLEDEETTSRQTQTNGSTTGER